MDEKGKGRIKKKEIQRFMQKTQKMHSIRYDEESLSFADYVIKFFSNSDRLSKVE